MSLSPKVSVVVPNYNHGRFLRQRIDSILDQTFQDFELILLDDCSTDDSKLILSQYASDPRVRIEFNEVNSGTPFKQWNKGVGIARAEYVWIAESDDYADPAFLEKLCEALDANPNAAFAYCRSWRISVAGEVEGFADPWFDESDRWTKDYCADAKACCRDFIRTNIVPNASAVVFRKTVYQRVGGADESLRMCGDWKLWTAMVLLVKLIYVSEPLNFYRFHEASVRSIAGGDGTNIQEIFQVRCWILDQITRAHFHLDDPELKRDLVKSWMHQAFHSYPDFPVLSRLALERVEELGGTDYTPPFGTWRGELLKRVIGWKAARRANRLYHRFIRADWQSGRTGLYPKTSGAIVAR